MTRPDPAALGRAVGAAFRFDPSVRADPEHLGAVLHDIEPSLRPAQVLAIAAGVHGDLAAMIARRPAESDAALAQRFAGEHPDFDAAVGVDVVRAFRQATADRTLPPPSVDWPDQPAETAMPPDAPTAMPPEAPTAMPPEAPTVIPPAPEPTLPPAAGGAATQLRPEYDLTPQPTRPAPSPKRSRRAVWIGVAAVVVVAAVVLVLVLRGGNSPNHVAGSTSTPGTTSARDTSDATAGSTSRTTTNAPAPRTAAAPPSPFKSAALYDNFARPFFTADQCEVPKYSPDHPFPFKHPDKELVNCTSAKGSATLWCKHDVAELAIERGWYLHVGVARQAVTGKPAGWPKPGDHQYSYLRGGIPGEPARVYWDSPSLLCGAELQAAPDESRAELIAFFHTGR